MKSIFYIILLAVIVSGAYVWFKGPDTSAMLRPIPLLTAEELRSKTLVTLIDARPEKEFKAKHLERSLNIREDNFQSQFLNLMGSVIPETDIVVFAGERKHIAAERVIRKLQEKGLTNVYLYKEGFEHMPRLAWISFKDAKKKLN